MLRGVISCTIACVSAAATVLAAEPRDNEATRNLKQLQGTWKQVTVFSHAAEVAAKEIMIVEDRTMIFMDGDKASLKLDIALDPVPHPKQIDLAAHSSDEEKQKQAAARELKKLGKPAPDLAPPPTMLGIYEFGGKDVDQFVLCFRPLGKARPTELASGRDDDAIVMMFRRVKNGAAGDLKRLQGTWRPKLAIVGAQPREPKFTIIVKDDVMTWRDGEKEIGAFDMALCSSSDPKRIDLTVRISDADKKDLDDLKALDKLDGKASLPAPELPKILGIYYVGKLKNDEAGPDNLILMYEPPANDPPKTDQPDKDHPKKQRPTEFSSKVGDDAILLTFTRDKE